MPLDLIVAREKSVCPVCGMDIYEARLKLVDTSTEGRSWFWTQGYECGCGRFVRDRHGNRQYVERLEDKDRNENLRQIVELVRGTENPQQALERMLEDAERG